MQSKTLNFQPSTFNRSYDFLWLGIALFPLLIIAVLLPLQPHDYWWYLRLGKDVLESGAVPAVDTYSWIQAGQRRTQSYAFFLAEIPLGFKGVADLRTEDGRIVIVERETGKTTTVKSSQLP